MDLGKKDVGRSLSNAEQLDLLNDLNSKAKSSDFSKRGEEGQQRSVNEAHVEEDEEAVNHSDDLESGDRDFDNFLITEHDKKKTDSFKNNFLNEDSDFNPPTSSGAQFQKESNVVNFLNQKIGKSKDNAKKLVSLPTKAAQNIKPQLPVVPAIKKTNTVNTKTQLHPAESKIKITAYEVGRDNDLIHQLRTELNHKIEELVTVQTQFKGVTDLKIFMDREITDLKKRMGVLQGEKNNLVTQLEMKDQNINELILDKKVLEQDNTNKTRLLKDRQELTTKSYVNSAIENQKRVYEAELENRKIKIEMLEQNLKSAEDRINLL